MIFITLLGVGIALVAAALRTMPAVGYPRLHLAIALLPFALTTVVPLPFAAAAGLDGAWTRQVVVALSVVGIMLSFILAALGIVLIRRALRIGDRPAVKLLALETVLAGIPGAFMATYAAVFLL